MRGFGGQLFRGNLLGQLQLPVPALRGVEVDFLRQAIKVARRIWQTQVGVGIKQGLREVIPRRQAGQVGDREGKGARVGNRDCTRGETLEVTCQDLRRIEAGSVEREARFGIGRFGQNDEQPAILG